jgi:hypothetical protein
MTLIPKAAVETRQNKIAHCVGGHAPSAPRVTGSTRHSFA